MSEQHGDRQFLRIAIIKGLLENSARFAAHQWHQKACVRQLLQDQFGSFDIGARKIFDFALAAAGKKCEHLCFQRNVHRLAHLGALWLLRQHVSKRVPDIIHRNTGLPVELGLMRKQREHVRNRALYFMDALTAPCPYRRTDVVDGGYALLLEREFQIDIEIRRVYRDEQIRAISQKIGAQLAANADDLEIVAQHFHITVHRQLFHREQHFHACGLHLWTADAHEL